MFLHAAGLYGLEELRLLSGESAQEEDKLGPLRLPWAMSLHVLLQESKLSC